MYILFGKDTYPEATARISAHKSILNQAIERLPYRCSAHSELFGERHIGEASLFLYSRQYQKLPDLLVRMIDDGRNRIGLLAPDDLKDLIAKPLIQDCMSFAYFNSGIRAGGRR